MNGLNKLKINIQHLSQLHAELFHSIHAKHLKALGTDEQSKRSLTNVTRVMWDEEEQCLKVWYSDGEWWHYGADGEFY